MNMKSKSFYPKKAEILHIETGGCIINIHAGLYDKNGKKVTIIEVIADQYVSEEWDIEVGTNEFVKSLSFRVIERK